jgi:hypothetical protein
MQTSAHIGVHNHQQCRLNGLFLHIPTQVWRCRGGTMGVGFKFLPSFGMHVLLLLMHACVPSSHLQDVS